MHMRLFGGHEWFGSMNILFVGSVNGNSVKICQDERRTNDEEQCYWKVVIVINIHMIT